MRLFFALLTTLAVGLWTNAANAQWKLILVLPDNQIRISFDTSSLYQYDGKIWVDIRYDYAEPQTSWEKPHLSVEARYIVNCLTPEITMLSFVDYAEPEGRGEIINAGDYLDQDPMDMPPDSYGVGMIKSVCDEWVRQYKPTRTKFAGGNSKYRQ